MSNIWSLNWKNVAEYSHIRDATNEQYAWEFLRRNPKYQDDFELNKDFIKENKFYFVERFFAESIGGEKIAVAEDMRNWYGLAHHSDNYDPSIDVPPTFDDSEYPHFSVPFEEKNKKINDASNTRIVKSKGAHKQSGSEQKKVTIYVDPFDWPEEELDPSEFNVCISTKYDLDSQIKKIQSFYEEHKKKYETRTPRKMVDNFEKYLRILDALSNSAKKEEMFTIYYAYEKEEGEVANESTLNRHIKLAKKIRDGGYIKLVRSKILSSTRPESSDLIHPKNRILPGDF